MPFCTSCGTGLVAVETSYFSAETGARRSEFVCTNLHCEVGCRRVGHVWKPVAWWRRFLGGERSCTRCGYTFVPWD